MFISSIIDKLDKLTDGIPIPDNSYVSGIFLYVPDFDVKVETEQRYVNVSE